MFSRIFSTGASSPAAVNDTALARTHLYRWSDSRGQSLILGGKLHSSKLGISVLKL